MKLRLENNIVKIRLSPEEIAKLNLEKTISEKLQISKGNDFSYSVCIDNNIKSCTADFENNSLNVCVPSTIANKWIGSNKIGIKESIESEFGEEILLIVEEDLPPRKKRNIK